jgi:hypothetical protein
MKFDTTEFDEEFVEPVYLFFYFRQFRLLLVQMSAFLCACDFDVAHAKKVYHYFSAHAHFP